MRLKRYLLLVFLVCPMFAYGQGSRKDDVATKNLVTGLAAAPGALITVCTSAGVGVPCTPLANIYSDVGLTSLATNGSAANAVSCSIGPTTNPCLADSNGNYGFYASPGRYVVTVTGAGTTGKSVVYTLACDPSASCTVSGTTTLSNVNKVISVDGTTYTTVQACVNAAASLASPGKCYVPTGTATNTSQVEMASGVTLEFAPGTFLNTCSPGNVVFVHFASGVSNATVKGQGVGSTILKNNTGATQCGSIVQDEGTDNTVSDMTLDGNTNTTSTGIWKTPIRPKAYRLRLLHNTGIVAAQNYAVDIRGGNQFDFADIETVGGSLGGFSIVTSDGGGNYGNISGGRFANLYAHDSRHNGYDFRAAGTSNTVSGLSFVNILAYNNGTSAGAADDTLDDQFGIALIATLAADGSNFTNNNFYNVIATGNKSAGVRMKGAVNASHMVGVQSFSNGTGGTVPGVGRDGISIVTSQGTSAPANMTIIGLTRKGGGTNAISTDANTTANEFDLNVGSDAISLGNQNDTFKFQTNIGGQSASGPLAFGQVALTSDLTQNLPAIYNRSGAGLNIRSGGQINAILSAGQSFNIQSAPGSNAATFLANGGFDLLETAAPSGSGALEFFWGDSTTHTPSWNNNNNGASSPTGAWQCTNVTPVTVNANVATDQNLMACTIPAGTLNRVGRSLQINIAGVYSTVAASTASLTYKVKLCTVSGCGSGTVITLASIATGTTGALTAASFPFNITLQSTTQTAGASSAYEAHGRLVIDITSALAADSVFADSNTATVGTIDDTAQLFLQVTAASASASASNSWTQRQLIVQTIN